MADSAFNFEEGKYYTDADGALSFQGDWDKSTIATGNMQAFAESSKNPNYHYGDFMSGSAVRGDAPQRFEMIHKSVSRGSAHRSGPVIDLASFVKYLASIWKRAHSSSFAKAVTSRAYIASVSSKA